MSGPWKPCDIRGIVPAELHGELYFAVGRSAVRLLPHRATVLVAGDFRLTTPQLKARLIEGLLSADLRILDAGSVPTPIAYHAHRALGTAAVFIVTASHSPANHNGLKLMFGTEPPTGALFSTLKLGLDYDPVEPVGTVAPYDAVTPYREWMVERWREALAGFPGHVVLDAGNGAMAGIGPEIFRAIGLNVEALYDEPDGRFPNRPPDPSRPELLSLLKSRVMESHAVLGLAWDGDGDRVAALDANGRYVTADQLSILLARHALQSHWGAAIVHDIKLSDVLASQVRHAGGKPLMERSGHAFIKARMRRENAVFGCEASGHYFFHELDGGDDGLFTALAITELVHRHGPLADQVRALPEIFVTDDIRIPSSRMPYPAIINALRSTLELLSVETIDGERLRTPEGVVLARPSVTESATTVRIEGNSKQEFASLLARCRAALGGLIPA